VTALGLPAAAASTVPGRHDLLELYGLLAEAAAAIRAAAEAVYGAELRGAAPPPAALAAARHGAREVLAALDAG